jgi:hypothetical protein
MITIGSHENADLRSGFPLLGGVPGPVVNCARINFFFPPSIDYHYDNVNTVCPSRRGVLCTLAFQLSRASAALAHCVPTCQLFCILTPHRLGGAIGHPGRLGTRVPSLPPAKQHYARLAEGGCVTSGCDGRRLKALAIWKMYATLVLGVCVVALLCYPLPGELSRLCVYVARVRG